MNPSITHLTVYRRIHWPPHARILLSQIAPHRAIAITFVEGALGTVRYGTLACCLGDLQTSREGETRHFGDPKDGVRYLNSLSYVLAVELEPEPTKPHFLWSLLKHIIEKSTLLDLKKSATSYSGPNTENAIIPHHCRCHS